MFARKEKPLPVAVLKPLVTNNTQQPEGEGIHLGEGYYWNPETLPNGHIVAIGASGSGKTQTLKAIAYSLHKTYPDMQVILLDFHGDQEIIGETCYPIHMASPHGINPLVVNLDPEGGGSNLQAIQIAGILKKSLRLGPNQEGMLIEIIKTCYLKRGIVQERQETWNLEPPNFDDLEEELNRRRPIPEINSLPPVSYAEEEAEIKLKQQKLTEAEQAIALAQKKIESLTQLQTSPSHLSKGGGEMASPLIRGIEGDRTTPNIKLILEHEQANLKNLETAKQEAQIQLEVAQSQLTTAKEQRAYIEYQRQLEQTRRAIALSQQHQAIQQTESERQVLLAEREYSIAQIETQIQEIDYQIEQLSTVKAPYEGTIKKVKWTGQSDHNLTALITLAVNDHRSTIANDRTKSTPTTEVRETREEDK
jgi:energy-coupling factor transporter ATP-binding protein EcfA2